MTKCINLAQRFRRYRTQYEESYHAEYGPGARVDDPVYIIIPCRYGHYYPAGADRVAASVDGFPKVAGRPRRLPCVRVHQDGDFGELTVIFAVADFARVARIMRPRRRRPTTEAERERLRGLGFQKGQQLHYEVQHSDHTRVSSGQVDSGAITQQQRLFAACEELER